MSRGVTYDESTVSETVILLDPAAGVGLLGLLGLLGHPGAVLKLLVAGHTSGVVFADTDAVKVFAVALHELAEEMERPQVAHQGEEPKVLERTRSDLFSMRAALRAAKDEKK